LVLLPPKVPNLVPDPLNLVSDEVSGYRLTAFSRHPESHIRRPVVRFLVPDFFKFRFVKAFTFHMRRLLGLRISCDPFAVGIAAHRQKLVDLINAVGKLDLILFCSLCVLLSIGLLRIDDFLNGLRIRGKTPEFKFLFENHMDFFVAPDRCEWVVENIRFS
jgi:hypothetical protein